MKQIKLFTLLFFSFVVMNAGFAQEHTPIVGGLETISFQFTESSIQFPINYEITAYNDTITITAEQHTESGVSVYQRSEQLSKNHWDQLSQLAGNMQEAGTHYPEMGTGYKTYQLIRINSGAIEAHVLLWTSMMEDKIDTSSLQLAEKLKELAPSLEGVFNE